MNGAAFGRRAAVQCGSAMIAAQYKAQKFYAICDVFIGAGK
jgi:hypothetical protein